MNKSPEVKELAKALAGFQVEVANVPKNGVNPCIRVASPLAVPHFEIRASIEVTLNAN